jgi:NAD dependent epimerase/dehydratase family enzyme
MSWIALSDVVGAIRQALVDDAMRGPMNVVAPNPVRNEEMTRALSHELHRPALFTVPRFALELILGEMADAAVLASQRVAPNALHSARYAFGLPTIEQALASIL